MLPPLPGYLPASDSPARGSPGPTEDRISKVPFGVSAHQPAALQTRPPQFRREHALQPSASARDGLAEDRIG